MFQSITLGDLARSWRSDPILKLQDAGRGLPIVLDLLSFGGRISLGTSFVLSVLDRVGLYGKPGDPGVVWGTFGNFLTYTAQVNAFAPSWMVPYLGIAASTMELLLGVTLILGVAFRWAAFGTAGLLLVYGSAMAISLGIKAPFDWSVFGAMFCALFLGFAGTKRWSVDSLW